MKTYTPTVGGQALAAICKKTGGFPRAAKLIGCAASAPRHWASGRRSPSPAWRAKLFATYGIPEPAWDAPAVSVDAPVASSAPKATAPGTISPKAIAATAPPPPVLPSVPDPASTEESITWTIARLKDLQASVGADTLVSVREKTGLLSALTTALSTRARLRGEDSTSLRKVLASSWWKQVEKALARGLRGHPAAAAQVARELEALDRQVNEQEPRPEAGGLRP